LKPAWVVLLLVGGVAAACGSVPDITFVDVGPDGGADATSDGSAADGGSDASGTGDGNLPLDGPAPTECPTAPPAGFSGCLCGSTPCKAVGTTGTCSAAACASCGTCAGTEICCARNTANMMCTKTCN
jgi:hypothetical protein